MGDIHEDESPFILEVTMKKITVLFLLALFFYVTPSNASIFTIWADSSGDGFKDLVLGTIYGYEGEETGRNNYNYFSASAHPLHGPNLHPHRLKIFVYERTTNGRDFLNLIAGEDEGGSRHAFSGLVDITGSIINPEVKRSDDGGIPELIEGPDNHFEGEWQFRNNSDGGVIGPLTGNWEAKIRIEESNLRRHVFASNGSDNIRFDDLPYEDYFISPGVVPEPSSVFLLGSGLIGLVAFRRRKKT